MVERHMKRCSTLLIIREMQIKTAMSYHPSPVLMAIIKSLQINVREDVEKRKLSCTVNGNMAYQWELSVSINVQPSLPSFNDCPYG